MILSPSGGARSSTLIFPYFHFEWGQTGNIGIPHHHHQHYHHAYRTTQISLQIVSHYCLRVYTKLSAMCSDLFFTLTSCLVHILYKNIRGQVNVWNTSPSILSIVQSTCKVYSEGERMIKLRRLFFPLEPLQNKILTTRAQHFKLEIKQSDQLKHKPLLILSTIWHNVTRYGNKGTL